MQNVIRSGEFVVKVTLPPKLVSLPRSLSEDSFLETKHATQ